MNTTSPVEPIKTQGRGEKSSPTTGRSASATQTRKEALPFEKFSGGKVYSIIVATRVMDRPSFRTVPIAKLQRGDTVLVEAQVGDWLKLRSKKGSPGYILAQDAKEQRD